MAKNLLPSFLHLKDELAWANFASIRRARERCTFTFDIRYDAIELMARPVTIMPAGRKSPRHRRHDGFVSHPPRGLSPDLSLASPNAARRGKVLDTREGLRTMARWHAETAAPVSEGG